MAKQKKRQAKKIKKSVQTTAEDLQKTGAHQEQNAPTPKSEKVIIRALLNIIRKGTASVRSLSQKLDISKQDVYVYLQKLQDQGFALSHEIQNLGQASEERVIRLMEEPISQYHPIFLRRESSTQLFRPYKIVLIVTSTWLGHKSQQMRCLYDVYGTLLRYAGWAFDISQSEYDAFFEADEKFSAAFSKLKVEDTQADFCIHAGDLVFGDIIPSKENESFLHDYTDKYGQNLIEYDEKRDVNVYPPYYELQTQYVIDNYPKNDLGVRTRLVGGRNEFMLLKKHKYDILRAIALTRKDIVVDDYGSALFQVGKVKVLVWNPLRRPRRGFYTLSHPSEQKGRALSMALAPTLRQHGIRKFPDILLIAGNEKYLDHGNFGGMRMITLPSLRISNLAEDITDSPNQFGVVVLRIHLEQDGVTLSKKGIDARFIDLSKYTERVGF